MAGGCRSEPKGPARPWKAEATRRAQSARRERGERPGDARPGARALGSRSAPTSRGLLDSDRRWPLTIAKGTPRCAKASATGVTSTVPRVLVEQRRVGGMPPGLTHEGLLGVRRPILTPRWRYDLRAHQPGGCHAVGASGMPGRRGGPACAGQDRAPAGGCAGDRGVRGAGPRRELRGHRALRPAPSERGSGASWSCRGASLRTTRPKAC